MGFPLEGVRILELGQIIAGTYGGQVLADLGAEVIKIETPAGDLGRNPSVAPYRGASGLFMTLNRNKKSMVIDLKSAEGLALFHDLVKVSDVVVDNFRPGVLERLRIDYATLCALNPRIIQCSITGFGSTGAYKDYPSLDIIAQAMSGHMAITGEPDRPPARVGIPLADMSGGIYSCKGILAALYARSVSGRGQRVELSIFDAMLALTGYIGTMWLTNGELPRPYGSAHDYTVPWQAFKATDGYLVVAAREEVFWRNLCGALEAPELAADPRFASNAERCRHRDVLVPMLEAKFARATVADWLVRLRAAEVPCAPVNHFDGAFAEPPVAEREMILECDHPQVGKVRMPGNPIKFSDAGTSRSDPAPLLGEDTDAVLSGVLGLDAARIAELRRKRTVA